MDYDQIDYDCDQIYIVGDMGGDSLNVHYHPSSRLLSHHLYYYMVSASEEPSNSAISWSSRGERCRSATDTDTLLPREEEDAENEQVAVAATAVVLEAMGLIEEGPTKEVHKESSELSFSPPIWDADR